MTGDVHDPLLSRGLRLVVSLVFIGRVRIIYHASSNAAVLFYIIMNPFIGIVIRIEGPNFCTPMVNIVASMTSFYEFLDPHLRVRRLPVALLRDPLLLRRGCLLVVA